MLMVSVIIYLDSGLPILHISERFGRHKEIFSMPKFRTMDLSAPQVATHLLFDHSKYTTKIGQFLRWASIDELPQLLSVLSGKMTLVGPRPALFNQHDLVKYRERFGVNELKPGITGLAQVLGRDSIAMKKKLALERIYLRKRSTFFDLKILLLTLCVVLRGKNVSH